MRLRRRNKDLAGTKRIIKTNSVVVISFCCVALFIISHHTPFSCLRSCSVYLSSPFIVSHGVGYTQSSWDERIMAVQCRCLFTRQEIDDMHHASEHDWRATMETVSACLGKKKQSASDEDTKSQNQAHTSHSRHNSYIFRLPSLTEVQVVFEELLPQWQTQVQVEASSDTSDTSCDDDTTSATTTTGTSTSTSATVSLVQFMKQNPHEGISDE